MALKRTPALTKSLIFFITVLFAVSLTSGFHITLGGYDRSITSLIGVGIFLIFCVSLTRKLQLLPLSIAVVFFIPTSIDIFVNQEFGTATFVFIFNLLTFYFLAVLVSNLSNDQVSFIMASFAASFLAFAVWHYTTNDYSHFRFFYNIFNPNEVAIIGLSSLAFIYFLSDSYTDKFFSAALGTALKVILLLSVMTIIFFIAATGTRFAVIGSVILSLSLIIKSIILAKTSYNSKYKTTLYATGLIFSVVAMTGFGGLKNAYDVTSFNFDGNTSFNFDGNTSDRMIWSSENENIYYTVGGLSKPLVYDLGKVDGSISSLGGRLPSWKLAYYMSLHHPLSGIGSGFFNAERERLKIPSAHNFLVESYIVGGVLGGAVIAGLLILSLIFGISQYLLNNTASYLILGSLLIISMMMNLWHLKVFWFLLSILVGHFMRKKA